MHLGEPWPERPGVAQFLYLSALLHAIAILLFGAPPGGSPEGRAIWGSIDAQLVATRQNVCVTLMGPSDWGAGNVTAAAAVGRFATT